MVETVTTAVLVSASYDCLVDCYRSFVFYRKGREDLVRNCRSNVSGSRMKIDPILLSVYARTFRSITDEMSISMQRTTRSPILCEAKDFVTGLYDAEGRMLEQTENLPILAFSLAPVCKYIRELFRRRHPSGRRDLPQRRVLARQPEQRRRRLQADLLRGQAGGLDGSQRAPGRHRRRRAGRLQSQRRRGLAGGAADSAGQGLRKGKLRKDVWELIFANIRFDIVQHDMKAEIGACGVGERGCCRCSRNTARQLRGAQAGAVRRHRAR